MSFGIIVEAGVIDEQCTPLMIDESRVVTLGKFGSRHGVPLIVGQDLHADAATDVSSVVENVAVVDGRLPGSGAAILVGSIGFFTAEDAYLVATIGNQSTIAHEEVVVVSDMLDVGSLTRDIVTTRNLLAEVGVAGHVLRSYL